MYLAYKTYYSIIASLIIFILAISGVYLITTNKSYAEPDIVVYKSPTCGCCNKWITHLKDNGFDVNAINKKSVNPIKAKYGVSPKLASCHTALINGYIIEGHVPAKDIKRLLKEKPNIKGLTVPAMPLGTPGMEQGKRKDPYNVLTFDNKNNTTIFSSYNQ